MSYLILIMFATILAGFSIVYLIRRRELGSKAAARDSGRTIVILTLPLIIVVVVLRFFPSHMKILGWGNGTILPIILIVFCWAFIVFSTLRKRHAGRVLLDLGRIKMQKINTYVGGVIAVVIIIDLVRNLFVAGGETEIKEVLNNLATLTIAAALLYWGLGRNRISEKGITYLDNLLIWKKIGFHKWEGQESRTLTLMVRRRGPVFRAVSFPVPAEHKKTVEKLLAQYLPDEIKSL